jgi:hypothetical protein
MFFPLAILSISVPLIVTVADEIPRFDVQPSCRGGLNSAISIAKDTGACVKNETAARDQLAKVWATFARADRVRCADMTRLGGPPSYVELLTCLEIARDIAKIHKEDAAAGKMNP